MRWLRLGQLTVSVLLAGALTACNYNDYYRKISGYNYASRDRDDPKMTRMRSYGSFSSNPHQHDNLYFEYSSDLSRRIAMLPGIYNALVFLTDRNAYVGIMTDWSAAGTLSRAGRRMREVENSGTMEGVYNVDNGSPKWDNRHIATPYNSYFTQKDPHDLSSKLRQTIGDEVRRLHPRVQEVHISANREFMNQLVEFGKESWAGRSLGPLTPDFNRLVQYMFGNGTQIPVPLYERLPGADSPGGSGPEPTNGGGTR